LLGAEPLKTGDNGGNGRYLFPALDQRTGADSTWADTLDTLRAPREREQKFWDWRRSSPIRPVVFEDPGVVTEEVVQLHLEHRVVQRLLGRFTAQGFVHHDLSRACMAQSSDAVARVVLIGRLALYGPGAARLHEELVPISARWIDPVVRKGALVPYAREAHTRTLTLLNASFLEKHARTVPGEIVRQLQASAARDMDELLPQLEKRAEEHAAEAVTALGKRAQAESTAMKEILETQKKHIDQTVEKYGTDSQMTFGFREDELRQLDANRKYWQKRLTELRHELETEPQRIRGQYQVLARRIEPVGLVYLWPVMR